MHLPSVGSTVNQAGSGPPPGEAYLLIGKMANKGTASCQAVRSVTDRSSMVVCLSASLPVCLSVRGTEGGGEQVSLESGLRVPGLFPLSCLILDLVKTQAGFERDTHSGGNVHQGQGPMGQWVLVGPPKLLRFEETSWGCSWDPLKNSWC